MKIKIFFGGKRKDKKNKEEEDPSFDKNQDLVGYVDKQIKFVYVYSSSTNTLESLTKIYPKMVNIDINQINETWSNLKETINLSEMSLILLDGGNSQI